MDVPDKINGPNRRDEPLEPLEPARGGVTKGDLADVARWLEQHLGAARAETAALREDIDAHKSMVSDHLILIRAGLSGLQTAQARDAAAIQQALAGPRGKGRAGRGRIRWMLAVLAAFGLGLGFPVEVIPGWLWTGWSGP